MSDPLIETRGLKRHFHDGQRRLEVLDGIDLSIDRGEIVAIIGQSGSGKSTLLGLLGCLDRPTEGELYFHGPKGALRLDKAPQHELNRLRRDRMGFVFQFHHLLPELRAWENVAMPGRIARRPEGEVRRRARDLLDQVGLGERHDHIPGKLSGGEQQRVALARALMNEPDLILADEPTGNLDPRIANQVIDLLWRTVREGGRSMAIVTHELSIARRADRVLLLEGGSLRERPAEEPGGESAPVKA